MNNIIGLTVDGAVLKFVACGGKTESRVSTFFTKEPDTVEWIRSMCPRESFLDIGANVGMYTIYAASRGLDVTSVEPECLNFSVLNRNIHINGLSSKAMAYCVAIGGKTCLSEIHLSSFDYGRSLHTIDKDKTYRNQTMNFVYKHGVQSYTLGSLSESLCLKWDHIKVDVDGLDDAVVRSGWGVIQHAKSVLVELDQRDDGHLRLISEMESAGFKWDRKQRDSALRRSGPNEGVGNIIFRRAAL